MQDSLFTEVDIPLANKIDSYYEPEVQKQRVTQKDKIMMAMKRLKKASQYDLHKHTGIPRHLVPDRVLTLVKENKLKISGSKIDPLTNKQVTVYTLFEDMM